MFYPIKPKRIWTFAHHATTDWLWPQALFLGDSPLLWQRSACQQVRFSNFNVKLDSIYVVHLIQGKCVQKVSLPQPLEHRPIPERTRLRHAFYLETGALAWPKAVVCARTLVKQGPEELRPVCSQTQFGPVNFLRLVAQPLKAWAGSKPTSHSRTYGPTKPTS